MAVRVIVCLGLYAASIVWGVIGGMPSAFAQSNSPATAAALTASTGNVFSNTPTVDVAAPLVRPAPLEDLLALEPSNDFSSDKDDMTFDIRRDALIEAALSYGARGGLSWRSFEIVRTLNQKAADLDRIFDFRQLLIAAPSGLLIEPPVISEAMDSLLIEGKGLEAAVADRILNIGANARIVSAPRNWRLYLERIWGSVEPPPDILRPRDKDERKLWKEYVTQGWFEGIAQANATFEQDLARLIVDFNGMVRYRQLLAQNMVSPPYALQMDRGITGGGDQLKIGDRAVQITGLPQLIPDSKKWQPANR